MNHGDAYTVTGTGFGSKTKSAPLIWDNCSHGQAYTVRWTRNWHGGTGTDEDYRTPAQVGRGVALPHTHITKYGCAPCEPTLSNYASMFIKEVPNLTEPWWLVNSQYIRVDPNWVFDPASPDFNFKLMGMGTGSYPITGQNWYFAFNAGAGNFDNGTRTPLTIIVQDDNGGANFLINGLVIDYSAGMNVNPVAAWVKLEVVMKMSSTLGQGQIFLYCDAGGGGYQALFSTTTNNRTNSSLSAGVRTINSGTCYVRDRDATNNWVYWADNYVDHDVNSPARFYLTNNATFTSSTIMELQPYTSWSSTSVGLTCNQGKLSNGTVHLHLRDESSSNQYIGTQTLGAATSYPIRGFKV